MVTQPKPRAAGRWIGVVVLLVAFAIRVHDLAGQSFWWDEAYTALLAERGLRAIYHELRSFDFHPPLHYLLTWAWLPIAGRSEFALRYLSVAAGCLTVAVGARLGRRLYGERGGLAAGLVFAFSPFLVYYSREARMYALTALLAALALYLLHRALAEGRWRLWLTYAAACVLGLYTFYYFVFVPVFGGAWVLLTALTHDEPSPQPSLKGRGSLALFRWAASMALAALLYAPWLPVLLGRNAVWDSLWATASPPLKTAGWAWLTLTLGLPDLKLYGDPLPTALLAALGLALALGLIRRWRGGPRAYLFALLGFALPVALMAAIATAKPVFHPRYAVAAAPGLLLALAGVVAGSRPNSPTPLAPAGHLRPAREERGALTPPAAPLSREAGEGLGVRALPLLSALLLLASAGYGLVNLETNPAYARDDYRAAVGYIQIRLQPDDVVVYNADPGFRYYYRGAAPASFFPGPPYEEEHIAEGLNGLAQGKQRLWYLRHFEVPTDPEGFVERQLETHARKLEEAWFGPLRVTLYALPPTPEFAAVAFTPTRADFGGRLLLTGYALGAAEVPSGGHVELTLRWQVLKPDADYGVWAGLADDQGRSWGRDDRQPRNRDLQLSSRWRPGEVVTTRHELPALVGTPPGTYRLELGVYRLGDVRGLDLLDDLGRPKGQSFSPTSVGVVRSPASPAADASLPSQPHVRLAEPIELAAYKLDASHSGPGGRLPLTLLWRALAPPDRDYAVALRLVSADGRELARTAGPPADGRYPIREWRPGELVRDQRELDVPRDAPGGTTTLEVALLPPGAPDPPTWLPLGSIELDLVQRRFDEPEIPRRVDLDLGGQIRLLGYRLDPAAPKPGGTLRLTLYWRALADGERNYRVFTHLLDAESKIWGQKDGEPRSWTHPTPAWLKGEVVEDVYELEVQPDAPPGQYEVEVGMYDPQTGERLRVSGADGEDRGDRIVLRKVEVR